MINNFQMVFNANTGQKQHQYSGIWSQIPVKILGLGHGRNTWITHFHMKECPLPRRSALVFIYGTVEKAGQLSQRSQVFNCSSIVCFYIFA